MDLQDYFRAKMRLFEHTTGTSIINEQVFSRAKELGLTLPKDIPNVRTFGVKIPPTPLYQGGDILKDRTDGENIIVSGRKKYLLSETEFSGMHNAMNILSCVLVTNILKICSKRVRKYLKTISGLPHRLELVTVKSGVRFIDDSKSTSAQSLIAALGSLSRDTPRRVSTILIAGGSDKGDSFENLGPLLKEKVKHTELIGATREILGKICEQYGVSYHYSESMDEAVQLSEKVAKP